MKIATLLLALSAFTLLLLPQIAHAETEHYLYKISVLNIPIGEATIDIDQNGKNFDMAMGTQFGGIMALFTGAEATVTTHGRFDDKNEVRNTRTDGRIKWGKKVRIAQMDFDELGDITNLYVKPKYSYPPDERHPLDHATLKQVQDSFSSMYRPLKDGKLDCTVRVRTFDTKERDDLQFSPTDKPMVCIVQPIPISGYKLAFDKKGGEPKPLRITFASTADGQHALPVKIERDMLLGWLVIELKKVPKHS